MKFLRFGLILLSVSICDAQTGTGGTSVDYNTQVKNKPPLDRTLQGSSLPGSCNNPGQLFWLSTAPVNSSIYVCAGTTYKLTSLTTAASTSSLYNIKDFGAKGDGTTDDTAAFNNQINAIKTIGGTIYIPCGTYLITNTITISTPNISFNGQNEACVTLNYTGTGTALKFQMTPFTIMPAGSYSNFGLVGTNSGSIGLQTGCIVAGRFENFYVDGFTKSGAIGIDAQDRMDCNSSSGGGWMERNTFINVWSGGNGHGNNTNGFVFENVGGGNNSFGYNRFLNISVNSGPGQVGFWIKTNVFMYSSDIILTCNMDDNPTWTTAPICFQADGHANGDAFHLTGEYNGSHAPAVSVKINTGGEVTGTGSITIANANFISATTQKFPIARVTNLQPGMTYDAGTMAPNLSTPGTTYPITIATNDPYGQVNYGYISGASGNIAAPFISFLANDTGGDHFMVCPLNSGDLLSQCPGKSLFDIWQGKVSFSGNHGNWLGASNAPVFIGYNGGTDPAKVSGNINLQLFPATKSTGQINESISFSDTNDSGLGAIIGNNISHPIIWSFVNDSKLVEFFDKRFNAALLQSDSVGYIGTGGNLVMNGGATFGGVISTPNGVTVGGNAGFGGLITVKGSDGNNCTITVSGGIITAKTCP